MRARPAPGPRQEDARPADGRGRRPAGVNLKDPLRQIDPDPRDSGEFPDRPTVDGFPSDGVSTTTILAR